MPQPFERIQTVAVVGVGLIGGSFALAIREAGFGGQIIGVSSPRTIDQALALGVIDRSGDLQSACSEADLIYLANPISRIIEVLPMVAASAKDGALVTDAGSTKSAIMAAAEPLFRRSTFLGGHPMAGKAVRGVAEAEAGLFRGRAYVLTASGNGPESPVCTEFVQVLQAAGASVIYMSPTEHDSAVAWTSHLPQMASTALALTLAGSLSSTKALLVSGSGLADMTRLAGSSYEIWRDILGTNRDLVLDCLDRYIESLQLFRNQVFNDDAGASFKRAAELAGLVPRRNP